MWNLNYNVSIKGEGDSIMVNFWAMKTYKIWADVFIEESEIGMDEKGVDHNYTSYSTQQLSEILKNPRLIRRFDQFCKWAKMGDYVVVGVGQTT